ncbi:MAG: HEAT repeat domain-containing protein [Geobacteraceae bacterium]|nr:HEAT repeat domain-containing protein [Geobacteraceae bacterium]
MKLQEIENLLLSEDEEIRRSALKSLKGISLQDSLSVVIAAMGDPSWRVRKEAVEIFLGSTPDEESIEKLLELLRNEDNAGLRNSAAEAVIRLGSAVAVPLIKRVRDADTDVRKFIIDVMGAIGDPVFVQPLLNALNDPDVNVSSAAAEHLGALGDSKVTQALVSAIVANDSVLFRFSALEALGKLAPSGSVPDEILGLAEQDILRKAVYDYLGNTSDIKSVLSLVKGLSCRQNSARAASIKALYRINNRSSRDDRKLISDQLRSLRGSDAIPGLLELFDSRDAVLIDALIWCSHVTGDLRFVPLLIEAFVVDRFAEAALLSLKSFGQEGVAEIVARYSSSDENARAALCVLVGECGYAAYGDMVKSALKDNYPTVRKAAAVTVGKLGLISSIPDLVELIDDASQDVCSAAVASLQMFALLDRDTVLSISRRLSDSEVPGHRRYASLLLASLGESERLMLLVNDEDPNVRRSAVSSIGTLRAGTVSQVLRMALADECPDVRIAAADALGQMKEKSAVSDLEKILEDEDVWVQCAAMKSINMIEPESIMAIIKRLGESVEGLLMITCLQLLESTRSPEALSFIKQALENRDPDVVRQARKSLEICKSNIN